MNLRHGYKRTDVGILPEDWDVVELSDLLEFRNGVNADKDAYGQGTPFINVLEVIMNSHIRASDVPGRVELSKSSIDSYRVRRGDVLFNRTSETQEDVALASVYLDDEPVVFGGFVIRGRPRDSSIDALYSGYALRAQAVRSQIVARGQGAIRSNIGQGDLRTVVTPRPPIQEQRAIAAAISEVDALIGGLERLISKKYSLKQAATQLLLTGQRRLPGFAGTWETRRFGEVATPRVTRVDPHSSGPYNFCIELENIEQRTGRLVGRVVADRDSSLKTVFRAGDVLFGKLRAYLRKRWLADRDGVCSTEIWALVPERRVMTPNFLVQVVATERFAEVASSTYGTHMPRSDWNIVRTLEIPTPDLPEQNAIAGALSDMDSEIDALGNQMAKIQELKQGMMQELLTGRTRLV